MVTERLTTGVMISRGGALDGGVHTCLRMLGSTMLPAEEAVNKNPSRLGSVDMILPKDNLSLRRLG